MPYVAKYILHNIPTGRRWKKESEFDSEQDFLRHLNDWNRRGNGVWLHSSVAYHAPALPVRREISSERMDDLVLTVPDYLGAEDELDELMGDAPREGC